MAVYAIGDIQGCFTALQLLLEKIKFDSSVDKLWFTGDLVNRGPESLEVLRFVKGLGASAVTVLGNHDLHLLAVAHGKKKHNKRDTLSSVLDAPDCELLLQWLAQQPLIHHDPALNTTMVHAGIYPGWDLATALKLGREVEAILTSKELPLFLDKMYGNEPALWSNELTGWDRVRIITNCFTRLRYCDDHGSIDMTEKGPPGTQPATLYPWYHYLSKNHDFGNILFGHWSTLAAGNPDAIKLENRVFALDTGCLWGGSLTALRLDGPEKTLSSVACTTAQTPWPL
ncbi:MAG: symmetrical bis(5'-nucleosyl)-tetraphosphatase [Acidiferrobacterales bacterium]